MTLWESFNMSICIDKKTLGETIRQYIKDLGYKQVEVCKLTGLSPSRLSNYLSGAREPDFATLCKSADALGVSLDDLRNGDNQRKHELILQAVKEGNAQCTLIIKTMHGTLKREVGSEIILAEI